VQVAENVEFPKPIVSCADERYHLYIENFFGAVYLQIIKQYSIPFLKNARDIIAENGGCHEQVKQLRVSIMRNKN
jgi:hypothetical protein